MGSIDHERNNRRLRPLKEKMSTYYMDRTAAATAPATEAQVELITKLRSSLEQAGVDISYIREPENKTAAHYIIKSLVRLRKKHGVISPL